MYSLIIENYFKNIKYFSFEELVSLYFSTICINMYVCQKAKSIENFSLNLELEIESMIIKIKQNKTNKIFETDEEKYKNYLSEASQDILKWCLENRNKNIL